MKKTINLNKIIGIVVLLLAVIGAELYFGHVLLNKKAKEFNTEVDNQRIRLSQLKNMDAKTTRLNEDINLFKKMEIDFAKKMPSTVKEETIIYLLKQIVDIGPGSIPITIGQISIENVVESRDYNQNASPQSQSTSDTAEIVDKVMSAKVSVTLEGKYSAIKQAIKRINNCEPKVVLKDMTLSVSGEAVPDPDVNATLTLEFLGYKGKNDKALYGDELATQSYSMTQGKSKPNIFAPFAGQTSNSYVYFEDKTQKAGIGVLAEDFYTILYPANYDLPALMIGKADNGLKTLSQDKDGVSQVSFVFNQKGGKYYFKYSIENKTFPASKIKDTGPVPGFEEFIPNSNASIVLKVRGNDLTTSKDKVGANIRIENNTNLTVNVNIVGIPQNIGRVTLVKKGKVIDNWK